MPNNVTIYIKPPSDSVSASCYRISEGSDEPIEDKGKCTLCLRFGPEDKEFYQVCITLPPTRLRDLQQKINEAICSEIDEKRS